MGNWGTEVVSTNGRSLTGCLKSIRLSMNRMVSSSTGPAQGLTGDLAARNGNYCSLVGLVYVNGSNLCNHLLLAISGSKEASVHRHHPQ